MSYFPKLKIYAKRMGFTFNELIVVMAVVMIIMTVLVVQQNSWNDQLAVNTQAYELSMMLRQAQIYSLGVKEDRANSTPGADKFDIGYGIYFDSTSSRYIFFADRDGDQKYDSPGELIETKTFTRGVTIGQFCGLNGGVERCSPDAGNINTLHISFFRPEPKANILLLNNGGNQSGSVNPPAIIHLKSLNNKKASVIIESNGQISVVNG